MPPPKPSPLASLSLRAHFFRLRKTLAAAHPNFIFVLLLANLAITTLLFIRSPPHSPFPSFLSAALRPHPRPYVRTPLQDDVRNLTRTLYRAYFDACRGHDEFDPVTGKCYDWFHLGLTTLDTLDTLLLMDLRPEYDMSRRWAEHHLNLSAMVGRVSVFELTIRALGGMLSAYDLSGHDIWRRKSVELGDLLLPFFDATNSSCPPMYVDFYNDRKNGSTAVNYVMSTPADAGTLQLEMRTLSAVSGDPRYARAADRCIASMLRALRSTPLAPTSFNVQSSRFRGSHFKIGGAVDSFYEMLLKTWVAFSKSPADMPLVSTFTRTVDHIYARLFAVAPSGLHVIGELWHSSSSSARPTLVLEMEHLSCFFPGTLALAALHGLGGGLGGKAPTDYVPRARELARTCYAMTRASKVGLAAEMTDFQAAKPAPKPGHDVSHLRPEIVEALFYLKRADPAESTTYERRGRAMWADMRAAAQVRGRADGTLAPVQNLHGAQNVRELEPQGGKLESFVLAETVKYFYLLFDRRVGKQALLPLDEWVFTTEAHPVRVRTTRHATVADAANAR